MTKSLSVPEEMANDAAEILGKTMIEAGKAFLARVPVEVEVTIGDTWAEKWNVIPFTTNELHPTVLSRISKCLRQRFRFSFFDGLIDSGAHQIDSCFFQKMHKTYGCCSCYQAIAMIGQAKQEILVFLVGCTDHGISEQSLPGYFIDYEVIKPLL